MPRLRVYIETSVWSFAFAEDVPSYRADTLAFFERCREGAYETFIGQIVVEEIERAPEPLRARLGDLLRDVSPVLLPLSPAAVRLAETFVEQGVVPGSKPEDARHVAVAFAEEVDVLVSWNFRHIANVRRVERFNAVAVLAGHYRPLRIVSPAEVLYDEEVDVD